MKQCVLLLFLLLFAIGLRTSAQHLHDLQHFKSNGAIGTASCEIFGIEPLANGGLAVAGKFRDSLSFGQGPNPITIVSRGAANNYFLANIKANGEASWGFEIAPKDGNTRIRHITEAPNGDILMLCEIVDSVDFDPSSTSHWLYSPGNGDGIALASYSPQGVFNWAKLWANASTGSRNYFVRGMNVDLSGNIYISGSLSSSIDLDPGTGTKTITAMGNGDGYLLKLDANGNYSDHIQLETSEGGYFYQNEVLPSGEILICGGYSGKANFNPKGTKHELDANGKLLKVFAARYNANLELVWVNSWGLESPNHGSNPWAYDITVNTAEETFVVGQFTDSTSINGNKILSQGKSDAYALKINKNGSISNYKTIGEQGFDRFYHIATDGSQLFLLMYFRDTIQLQVNGMATDFFEGNGENLVLAVNDNFDIQWAVQSRGINYASDFFGMSPTGNVYMTSEFSIPHNFKVGGTSTFLDPGSSRDFIVAEIGKWPLGIKNGSYSKNLYGFPNPGNGLFSIVNSGGQLEGIQVRNFLGEQVPFSFTKSGINLEIQINGSNGLYYVALQNDSGVKIMKYILAK